MDTILVVNAGSSSLKFEVFSVANSLVRLIKGQMEGIGTAPHLAIKSAGGERLANENYPLEAVPNLPAAMRLVGEWLRQRQEGRPIAVGHRVVHGGPNHSRPARIDTELLRELEQYAPLAPLHQPNNLAPIRVLLERQPELPQIACFDTAFHRGHDPMTDHYAIPQRYFEEGVRRYGFHGLSYEYVAGRLTEIAPAVGKGRVVVAHLGSGASMCALHQGVSVESTLGFTALDGLPMGTRSGAIDPGVLIYLMDEQRMDARELETLLYKQSGLLGLSGVSSDMRQLLASDAPRARFAIDVFVHRIAREIGALAAEMGGLDGLVFTAGIGEHAAEIRRRVLSRCLWLGLSVQDAANREGPPERRISTVDSRCEAWVIPTDEELMMARHTFQLLAGG